MTKSKPEVVPLKHAHLERFYGPSGRHPTVKGIAAFVEGELIAVAGFRYMQGSVIAFCDLTDKARPYKVQMHKYALLLMNEAKTRHKRIVAICDENEPTSARWLARLGFKPGEGRVWVWRTSD
jgi:hypothetical protein